ncbi:MAG: squalene--hopene cyclase [Pirellulales bacterium]
MAPQDPTQPSGGAARPLQPQPLRPMPIPLKPAPVPASNGAHPQPAAVPPAAPRVPQPLSPQPLPPQPMRPQPLPPQGAAPPMPRAPQPMPPGMAPQPLPAGAARPAPILVPQGSAMPQARPEPEEEQPAVEEVVKKNAPPWLISMVVQMLLVIGLALWTIPEQEREAYDLNASYFDQVGEELADNSFDFESEMPQDNEIALTDLKPVENPFAAPPQLTTTFDGNVATSDITAPVAGMALQGREVGMKDALLKAFGGDGDTEAAVRRGLEWLAKQQKADGSWSIKGPYPDGAIFSENSSAATAMAMLAFQGAGHTHIRGDFKKNVEKGMKSLLKKIENDGRFPIEGKKDQTLYTQAQCTIVLCELYAMSRDSDLRDPAQLAVNFCLAAQNEDLGGWRYTPGQDSDTSVTGWMVMALQSARMGGLEVPKENLDRVKRYLDKASQMGGARYSYQSSGGLSDDTTMTAEGLLCRQWLGWTRDDVRMRKGAEWLLEDENLPTMAYQDVYYWYYGTQLMHNLEGAAWKKWNTNMKGMLVKAQVGSGKERGSWSPTKDRWGQHAGRLYQTCLSLYILETYYRHLPLYSGAAK